MALHPYIYHGWSRIAHKPNLSHISDGLTADGKSYLFANTNTGTPAILVSSQHILNSIATSSIRYISAASTTKTNADVPAK